MGCICLAASLHGWLRSLLSWWERILLAAAALLLIKPGMVTDLIGFALLAGILLYQHFFQRGQASAKAIRR